MIWVWILLATPVVGFIGYHFIVGFVQGFRAGWQRPRWRRLKGDMAIMQEGEFTPKLVTLFSGRK